MTAQRVEDRLGLEDAQVPVALFEGLLQPFERLTSVELIDRLTRATRSILTTSVVHEVTQ